MIVIILGMLELEEGMGNTFMVLGWNLITQVC